MLSEDAPRIVLERCKRNVRNKLRVKVGARAKKTEREKERKMEKASAMHESLLCVTIYWQKQKNKKKEE